MHILRKKNIWVRFYPNTCAEGIKVYKKYQDLLEILKYFNFLFFKYGHLFHSKNEIIYLFLLINILKKM